MVNSGGYVSLTCVASGLPSPDVSWLRDGGQRLTNDTPNAFLAESVLMLANLTFVQSVLELCPVRVSDAGEYSCVAKNEYGNHSILFEIMVIEGKAIIKLYTVF